jgi:hypothetical protein
LRLDPKPTVPEVLPLAIAYHAQHPVWGNLHIVLEDGNVADKHVLFCAEKAAEVDDHEGLHLARLLLRMSKTQRTRLRGLANEKGA